MKAKNTPNQNLLDFAYHFKDIVTKEGWVPRYDVETDSLSFTVKSLPSDVRIRYINKELAFYLTPQHEVKGLFVEYFRTNFLRHQQDLESMKKLVARLSKENKEDIVELKRKEVQESVLKFGEILQESLAESVKLNKQFAY